MSFNIGYEASMFVCLCRAVTRDQIEDVVDAGAVTVNAVRSACGAGGDCGGCRGEIREVIRECLRRERRDDEAA
jgi:bacterioferritin-associated ferredoxin